jgi:hypothetical protein
MQNDDEQPVVIDSERPLRLSAEAMRALRKATGRSMSELLNDEDDDANRVQVMAFAELHRRGVRLGHLDDAATLWERAGGVEVDFLAPTAPDFLDGASSQTSPDSAGTGE